MYGMWEKTTERRLKDEFVVLEMTSLQYTSRETNPIRRLWPVQNEVGDLFSWLQERFLSWRALLLWR
jgi:hypothetical protein